MKKKIISFGKILKNTFKDWWADDPFRQSATIAYYAIFSLPALLVLIVNVVGFFFEKEAVSGEISRQIGEVMGQETANQVGNIVTKAGETKAGLIPGIIATVTIIFGATGVFEELQKSLDLTWDVKEKEKLGIFQKLKSKLFSFGLIISIGFLFLISLVLSTALAAMSHWLEIKFFEGITYVIFIIEFVVSLSVITLLFALMFKFLPDVKIPWKNIWVGALLTGLLFILGKYGLSIYFGKAQPASVYGAAGSIVLILLWVSYSSMIVFFGAEFTKQYAVFHKIKITVKQNAERINSGNQHGSIDALEAEHRSIKIHKDTSQKQKNAKEDKMKIKKMKSKKEFNEKIAALEKRLKEDKENIKDDFKFSHIFRNFIPRVLRVKKTDGEKLTFDDYLKGIAENHVSEKDGNMIERLKRLVSMEKDGAVKK